MNDREIFILNALQNTISGIDEDEIYTNKEILHSS